MQRRLSFALIAVFFAMQMLSSLHMAGYGFAEHKHHGHLCDIYVYSEQSKSADTVAAPVLTLPDVIALGMPESVSHVAESQHYGVPAARAPPVFS